MKNPNILLILSVVIFLSGCCFNEPSLKSPSGNNQVFFSLNIDQVPQYQVNHDGKTLIRTSNMGFELKDQPSMDSGFSIVSIQHSSEDETWEMPWGEQETVENKYNEMLVKLKHKGMQGRTLNIYFRAYDDGVAFRYEFPEETEVDTVIISAEKTQFNLTGDHDVWWEPGDWEIYEHLYNHTKFSQINAISKRNHPDLNSSLIPFNAVNTPVTMRTEEGVHICFHEANLTDYAGMTLRVDTNNLCMESELVGSDRYGYKVKRALPFETPWRMIMISNTAAGLVDSRLELNLNEPNKLGDIPWFKPMKYVGIWWEMHLGLSTWDYEATQSMSTFYIDQDKKHKQKAKHGATTENAKRYIDFASQNNMHGILVEGWNTGWDHWIGFDDREGVFDFVTPYPDYDLNEVVRYGKEHGVELIMHHETSAAPRTYAQQMDTAYRLMQSLGIHSVKTGYVGKLLPQGEYHHGQWMVNQYRKALVTAAKFDIAIDAHEPIKATGIRRTYPNAISREGLRGQEFNAWATDGGNPPNHLPTIAFTRMLAGPIDFTPGVFELTLKPKPRNQINTTLAQQLALYVVIYSPVQMACDLPENYEGHPALQFIRDVGVDWKQSKTLNGEIGEFVTIAREEKGTGNWFVGGITNEEPRDITISYDFLPEDSEFKAILYEDGDKADYKTNPGDYKIESDVIRKGDTRSYHLASGGGFAISLMK